MFSVEANNIDFARRCSSKYNKKKRSEEETIEIKENTGRLAGTGVTSSLVRRYLQQCRLDEIKDREAEPHGNGALDPVEGEAFVQTVHDALLSAHIHFC